MKPKSSPVWRYFHVKSDEISSCQLCGRHVPNKGKNTSNLRSHIRNKHYEAHKELCAIDNNKTAQESPANIATRASKISSKHQPDLVVKKLTGNNTSDSSFYEVLVTDLLKDFKREDDTAEQASETDTDDVWSYFNKTPVNKAQCILCKETFNRHLPFLKEHMNEKHQNIILDLPSESDDENCYTEVVYLEDDAPINVETKQIQKTITPPPKKLKLTSQCEFVNTLSEVDKTSKEAEVDDEIENFGRYVIGLLKKMPNEVRTQLQMDIISMIMTAKLKLETTPDTANDSVCSTRNTVTSTPSNVIVTTPSNVFHTTRNNASLPTLVIGVGNQS